MINNEEGFMTSAQAAQFLGIHTETLYLRIADGEVPARKIGGSWRFLRAELLEVGRSPMPVRARAPKQDWRTAMAAVNPYGKGVAA